VFASKQESVDFFRPVVCIAHLLLGTSTPLKDNDSFLQFSYGGGVKAIRLWGPIGLRADFRGRTLPNFYGSSLTFFEATGGFNIIWGER
jgi:hypothetical protein